MGILVWSLLRTDEPERFRENRRVGNIEDESFRILLGLA